MVKHLSTMRETWVPSLGQEDPLEKEVSRVGPSSRAEARGFQRQSNMLVRYSMFPHSAVSFH